MVGFHNGKISLATQDARIMGVVSARRVQPAPATSQDAAAATQPPSSDDRLTYHSPGFHDRHFPGGSPPGYALYPSALQVTPGEPGLAMARCPTSMTRHGALITSWQAHRAGQLAGQAVGGQA